MSIATFTLLTLAVYLVGLKFVSYFAYKASTNTTEDYFLANRGVGVVALIATTMASVFSTGTVVSSPSEFFTDGSGYFWIFFFSVLPLTMIPLVLRFWKLGKVKGFVTPGEMLADFYKSKRVQLVASLIGVLGMIPYAAAQLVAVGKTFEALTGGLISYSIGVTIVCAAIGVYLYWGGSRAVIWTDMVQGIIFGGLLLLTAALVLGWAGGWEVMTGNLLERAPEQAAFTSGAADIHYFEMLPLCMTFFFLPYVWQRMYMAKSASIVAKNMVALPFIFVLLFSATWVIGTSAITLFPEGLADGDNVLGAIFNVHAPYFGAFVLVAAFAAGMSTVDSQLLSAGSLFTHDFRPLLLRGKKGKFSDYKYARTITLALLGLIYVWSLSLQSASVLSLIILGVSLTVVFAPVVYGMFFWKRATEPAAFWSMTLGLAALLIKEFTSFGELFPTQLGGVSWALITSVVSFVVLGLAGSSEELREQREEYEHILSNDFGVSLDDKATTEIAEERMIANM